MSNNKSVNDGSMNTTSSEPFERAVASEDNDTELTKRAKAFYEFLKDSKGESMLHINSGQMSRYRVDKEFWETDTTSK